MDKSVSIHQRILQMLVTGIYKVRNDLGPEIMKDIFLFVQNHTIWEMIELCKGKEAAQCNLEQKEYLPLPKKYGN